MLQITESQFIQSHTVLKSVVHKYKDSTVLVLGGKGEDVRRVAEGYVYYLWISLPSTFPFILSYVTGHRYGFRKVCTTLDVHAWNPRSALFRLLGPFPSYVLSTTAFGPCMSSLPLK